MGKWDWQVVMWCFDDAPVTMRNLWLFEDGSSLLAWMAIKTLEWYKQNREPPHSTLPNSGKAYKQDGHWVQFAWGKHREMLFFCVLLASIVEMHAHFAVQYLILLKRHSNGQKMGLSCRFVSIVVVTFRPQIWVDGLTIMLLKNMSSRFLALTLFKEAALSLLLTVATTCESRKTSAKLPVHAKSPPWTEALGGHSP